MTENFGSQYERNAMSQTALFWFYGVSERYLNAITISGEAERAMRPCVSGLAITNAHVLGLAPLNGMLVGTRRSVEQ